ncbi:hypothetical protein L7F22_014144 [Adiantum nelumboides]|nr:hypothetical protein [Adiantum nelumboides]
MAAMQSKYYALIENDTWTLCDLPLGKKTIGLEPRKAVTVIAATNRPDRIDAALLRPGRFDRLLYVGPPDEAARLQIFEIHTSSIPCAADVDKRGLANCTNGYTGADIASICREAAMAALEENLNAQEVCMRHFSSALNIVQRSVSDVSESLYTRFSRGMQGGTGTLGITSQL